EQAGLSEFAHDGEFGEARNVFENPFDLDVFVLEDVQVRAVDFHGQRALESGEGFVHSIFSGLRVIENNAREGGKFLLKSIGQFGFVVNASLPPCGIVVWLQSHIKFIVEEAGWVSSIIRAAEFRADLRDHGIRHQNIANSGRKLAGLFERNCVRHRCAHPKSAFIKVRHEFAADVRNQEKSTPENHQSAEDRWTGMVKAPVEAVRVEVAEPFENFIGPFADVLEPVRAQHRNKSEREEQSAEERECHGVSHRMEKFSGSATKGVNRDVSSDDDGDGVEDGTVYVSGGGENHFVQFVTLAFAQTELAINVLYHHERAVDDDAEVDSTDRKQVSVYTFSVQ